MDRTRLIQTTAQIYMLFTVLETYTNVKIFISSRTENETQKSITLPLDVKHVRFGRRQSIFQSQIE